MSDEAAFLRAIQANPGDTTAKLVYADWLDEHGEGDKAEYLRVSVGPAAVSRDGASYSKAHLLADYHQTLPPGWLDLVCGTVRLWEPATLIDLGRLEGVLAALARCSDCSAVDCDFRAHLTPRPEGARVQALAEAWCDPAYHPLTLERLDDWANALYDVLTDYLFRALRQVTCDGLELAIQTGAGRDRIVTDVLRAIAGVISPSAGWRVFITTNQRYADHVCNIALEAADRVLFLHFSFSD